MEGEARRDLIVDVGGQAQRLDVQGDLHGSPTGLPPLIRPVELSTAERSTPTGEQVGDQRSATVISLRVSVPVLSVQMNVADPSVSTAFR
ncbi:hypothetical protein [Nonomuraea sp. NPDC003214]